MANEKVALNLSCHAGGQWKDDGSKSVKAASVNGVVVWLGNPRGGRGESEKEKMTEGGREETEGFRAMQQKMLFFTFFGPATKNTYTRRPAVVKQWRACRGIFSTKTRLNAARRKGKNTLYVSLMDAVGVE